MRPRAPAHPRRLLERVERGRARGPRDRAHRVAGKQGRRRELEQRADGRGRGLSPEGHDGRAPQGRVGAGRGARGGGPGDALALDVSRDPQTLQRGGLVGDELLDGGRGVRRPEARERVDRGHADADIAVVQGGARQVHRARVARVPERGEAPRREGPDRWRA